MTMTLILGRTARDHPVWVLGEWWHGGDGAQDWVAVEVVGGLLTLGQACAELGVEVEHRLIHEAGPVWSESYVVHEA